MKTLALEVHRALINRCIAQHELRQLFWECTLRCNLSCRHCGSDCKHLSASQDMPFETFKKALTSIKAHYDSHKIMIIITGGEPLMRKDLEICGREIYKLEFPWGIVTNGMLMTKQRLSSLLASGMRAATVSLDGLEEDHNWMRGSSHSFSSAVNAIQLMASNEELAFDVVSCVNRRNIQKLDSIKRLLIDLGVKSWRLFTVFPAGRAKEDPDMQLSPEELRSLMCFIKETRAEGKIKTQYACEGFMGEYEGEIRDYFFTCGAGINVASVLADGSISACPSIRSNYSQGNIHTDDFVEVWENCYNKYRDRSWMKTGPCAKCKYFRYCRGNGMHLRDSEGNLINCNYLRMSKSK